MPDIGPPRQAIGQGRDDSAARRLFPPSPATQLFPQGEEVDRSFFLRQGEHRPEDLAVSLQVEILGGQNLGRREDRLLVEDDRPEHARSESMLFGRFLSRVRSAGDIGHLPSQPVELIFIPVSVATGHFHPPDSADSVHSRGAERLSGAFAIRAFSVKFSEGNRERFFRNKYNLSTMELISGFFSGDRSAKSLILLVPKEGVEPPWPQGPRDFESRASANSATSALSVAINLVAGGEW